MRKKAVVNKRPAPAVIMENGVFPLLLLLLPLRHINQGVDISDTGYNLACFRYFGELDGMWVYVSYLANAVGHAFTKLPLGDTMIGMNLYCSLVVSVITLSAYFFLKKKIHFAIVFAGEVLAVMLCWCPQVILYNYLTYLALALGTVLLYRGIFHGNKICFVLAGVVLGLGVSARFSNLTHMALIIGLWYHGLLTKRSWPDVLRDTMLCVAGYAAGIAAYLLVISAQYGLEGYWTMLFGLKTMSNGAEGYSAAEMLIGAFKDYTDSMSWGVLFVGFAAAGMLFFRLLPKRFHKAGKLLFVLGLLVLLRFVYGRGMFGFDYNTYFSIFWWVSLFHVAALLLNGMALFQKGVDVEERVLCALVFVTILILPLGSNNRSYPVINNLFFIAPVTLYRIMKCMPEHFPVKAVSCACLTALFIQSIGFGSVFVFRDGSFTEKRDTKVENNGILKGMYTTKANAVSIREIMEYCGEEELSGKPVILYGDIPGLSYLLDMPSAITSTWANLDSYNMTFWNRDFAEVEQNIEQVRPVVMIGKKYRRDDEKADRLQDFLDRYDYKAAFENDRIILYR